MAIRFVQPQIDKNVLDPACGTGGFLVAALKYTENLLKANGVSGVDLEKAKTDYAINQLKGIDFNPDLVKVSKMRMILEEDGHTGIFHANSLDNMNVITETALKSGAKDVGSESVDIILTNPPFGKKGMVNDKEILSQYTLAKKYNDENDTTGKTMDEQVPDILFIERCHDFLREYGRMAIVLPDGILSNENTQFVRDFIFSHFKVVAIISLPYETFIPHGANVKASILVLQKLSTKKIAQLNENHYETFMAEIEHIGYQGNKNGTLIYKTTEKGDYILDEDGNRIILEDISDVVEAWDDYCKENKVWEK